MMGYVVIAERYLPDFIVWVAVTTKDEGFLKSTWAKFLLAITTKSLALRGGDGRVRVIRVLLS